MQNILHLAVHPVRPRSSRFVPAVRATLALWRNRSRWRRQLALLNDRDLADIGITRAEQFMECDKPFWRA
jgi:uncharacterized protein YjiS (DUF1127 family)